MIETLSGIPRPLCDKLDQAGTPERVVVSAGLASSAEDRLGEPGGEQVHNDLGGVGRG